jgi:hypothetical protein
VAFGRFRRARAERDRLYEPTREIRFVAEAPNESHRQPCPGCGSTRRIFDCAVVETIHLKEKLVMKVKSPSFPGKGHLRVEQEAGDSFHRSSGKWSKKERIIDRENDHYFEKFTDAETGVVTQLCEQPLSEHTGHGSAEC